MVATNGPAPVTAVDPVPTQYVGPYRKAPAEARVKRLPSSPVFHCSEICAGAPAPAVRVRSQVRLTAVSSSLSEGLTAASTRNEKSAVPLPVATVAGR